MKNRTKISSLLSFLPAWLPALAFVSCAKVYCPVEIKEKVDFKEAVDFAKMADMAYAPDDSVMQGCRAADSCFILVGDSTKARAVVVRNDAEKFQWIAFTGTRIEFRGTHIPSDVRLDVDYAMVSDSLLLINLHRGFRAGADELLKQMLDQHRIHQGYQTFLSGHSLGGAMAVIAALRLQDLNYTVIVRTFGQPKVTKISDVEKVDKRSMDLLRFVNGIDLVPLLPPVDLKKDQAPRIFGHFGREINLDHEGGYLCLEAHSYKLTPEEWMAEANKRALSDHGLGLYIEKLEKLKAVKAE